MELMLKGPRKKNEKRRRSWSMKEEEVLINALKDIISKGWKCENGFKTGYLRLLERVMMKAFPDTDIKAEPHINSKIHVWKKHHGSLASMLRVDGISWDDSKKMIDAREDAWNSYVKIDTNARTMRAKSWPFYPDWCEIFGKDRIIRENNAVDFVHEIETPNKGKEKEAEAVAAAAAVEACCIFDEENEMSVCQPESGGGAHTKKKRKAPAAAASECSSDPFVEAINVFCDKLDARFEDIARRIGYEYDVSTARRQVYAELGKIPGISVKEKLTVAKFLVNNTGDLDLFISLPDEDKAEMVRLMLTGEY
ncbi:disease resistance protein [Striga asiatica]|uniref:Disease resistance protein n=1 Tax=Striga asiatica TaxID=4170 RepID=A0A5A7P8D4_STRAF|nr:disease resistance protein [Striga asiatica]